MPFEVKVTVTMACGCPTEPGGHWDSNKFRVVARLVREGNVEAEAPCNMPACRTPIRAMSPSPRRTGRMQVLAMDPVNANSA